MMKKFFVHVSVSMVKSYSISGMALAMNLRNVKR